jgi:hypothetical protein
VCTPARFELFIDLLDQVRSQDMVIIGVLTHYHLYLFTLPRACCAQATTLSVQGEKNQVKPSSKPKQVLPAAAGVSGSSIIHILPLRGAREAG